ncbi:MAG: DUF4422 domain-containing protein [Clostridia bacterium]|nr:DUF4422 domain-containing protein [Bacilli bacterium]MBR3672817.1 DUF4422 domain-containing protein [Clostridia bacterium]
MIYIIKHREYSNPIPKNYVELGVGNYFAGQKDNINELNPYLNEATGLYDIWKNKSEEIIGLCHYRRFFWYNNNILSLKDSKEILKDYDIIITKEVQFDKGIYEQLRSEIENPDVLDKYYNILIEKEPKLEEWFKLTSFSAKEMFVCKKELIDKYCEWLFPMIIPIIEQFIKEDADRVVNKRMIGHLVERLFAYWIWKNKLKCYTMEYKDI